jgi:hypothetical protein
MSGPEPLVELTAVFADIERQLLAHPDSNSVLAAVTKLAVERVPGAEYAGITTSGSAETFKTVASTGQLVDVTDRIQYQLGHGPCVDAILEQTVFNAADLRVDSRWPEFGRQAFDATGVVSMLSLRLFIEGDIDIIAGLNMYATRPAAFDQISESIGLLMATHGALAIANARHREQAENLLGALKNSRMIGMAMGVLMTRLNLTEDQAFDALRIVSQHSHRKLAGIAEEVVLTGELPYVPGGEVAVP